MFTKANCPADFILRCKSEPQKIHAEPDAILYARCHFRLNTETELIEFIGNGGLQDMSYVNTLPWRNNPEKKIMEIFIDAYTFRSNKKIGYIAFYKRPLGYYGIKSFHLNFNKSTFADFGNNPMKTI